MRWNVSNTVAVQNSFSSAWDTNSWHLEYKGLLRCRPRLLVWYSVTWQITTFRRNLLPSFSRYIICKGKGKIHRRISLEAPDGEQKYSCTLSLDGWGGGWSTLRPDHFIPGKETRYPLCRRPRCRSGEVQKCRPTGIRSRDLPALSESFVQVHGVYDLDRVDFFVNVNIEDLTWRSEDISKVDIFFFFIFVMAGTLSVYHWPVRPIKVKPKKKELRGAFNNLSTWVRKKQLITKKYFLFFNAVPQ